MKYLEKKLHKNIYFTLILAFSFSLLFATVWFGKSFAQEAVKNENDDYEFNDCHFHLTNYIQEGTEIQDYLNIMGNRVGRSTLFGIPLQQQWSYRVSGENAPGYYLESDAPLYYYSFTDAYIAQTFNSLSEREKKRFDPMITGFNPTDMYGVDHIKRVLHTFPGVFSGIGEFTIHKEFVSSKIAGEVASLLDPALDSILSFAGEAGLVVLIHNDIDIPFAKEGEEPAYLSQMKNLLSRHPETVIIWAHIGLGRVIHPVRPPASAGIALRSKNHIQIVREMLEDPRLKHVHFDISWSEVAKYIVRNDTTIKATADLLNSFPDRFLFGTDEVAPKSEEDYFRVFIQYKPLWKALGPETREKVCSKNYERIFDQARNRVRAWEEKENLAAKSK